MYQQSFGSEKQMQFASPHEFYKLLGYLAKSDGSTSLVWEHNENQGAWASEGRIQIHIAHMPVIGTCRLTAGNGGNVLYRINCNEFVENICTNHGFTCGSTQDVGAIRATIPVQYIADFDAGLAM